MPFYDYFCEKNGKTVEVFHSIKERLKTWGEVCAKAGIKPGKTSKSVPVIRLIAGDPVVWRLKGLDKDEPAKKMQI